MQKHDGHAWPVVDIEIWYILYIDIVIYTLVNILVMVYYILSKKKKEKDLIR